ncbi:MAG: AtpZ/AtpI family protein [Anaerolineaceae bacterium]|jgi:F0F1-type ATP synthase assembly protein I
MMKDLRQDDDLEETGGIPTRRRKLFSARDLRATTIGWEIAIPIVGGPLLGFILDRRFDSGVRWTVILLGVGLVAAISAVMKYIHYEFYLMKKEKEEQEKQGLKKVWRDYDDNE